MSEPTRGKWAAEVYDFMVMTGRFGRSIYGLLLAEIGWLLFVRLLLGITGPVTQAGQAPATSDFVWHLFLVGALLILAGWLVTSRFIVYLLAGILTLARWLLLGAVVVVVVPLVALGLVWGIIGALLRPKATIGGSIRRKGRHRRVWRILRTDKASLLFEKVAGQRALNILQFVHKASVPILRPLVAPVRIGIAPLAGLTFAEDLSALHAASQSFATAIARSRRDFRSSKTMRSVQVVLLPMHWRPRSAASARAMAWLFRLDVVVWGSFADPSGIAWLNLELVPDHVPKEENRNRYDEPPILGTERLELFPLQHFDLPRSMLLDVRDSHEIHVLVLMLLGQALWQRTRRKAGWLIEAYDEVRLGFYSVREELEAALIRAFLAMPARPFEDRDRSLRTRAGEPSRVYPTATRLVSDRIARRMGLMEAPRAEEMRRYAPLLALCSRRLPFESLHLYRLGALHALLNQEEEALGAFRGCLPLADLWGPLDYRTGAVKASMTLREVKHGGISRNTACARYSAELARALFHAGSAAPELAMEALKEIEGDAWLKSLSEREPALAVAVTLARQVAGTPQQAAVRDADCEAHGAASTDPPPQTQPPSAT